MLPSAVITLLPKLGEILGAAMTHLDVLRASGATVDPEVLAVFVEHKMGDWNPTVAGRRILDPQTRATGARFLAGIAINYTKTT